MSDIATRPGTVKFVAVVLFLFGTIYILNGLATGGLAIYLAANPDEADPKAKVQPGDIIANQRFFAKEIPSYAAAVITFSGLDLLFGIAQLTCGLGVLRLKPVARVGAILLVLLKFGYVLGYQIFAAAVIMPAQVRFTELHPPDVPGGGPQPVDLAMITRLIMLGGLGCTIVVQVVLTGLIVVLLNAPKAKASFAGTQDPTGADEIKPLSIYEGYDDGETPTA